ncbi:hypothetical protein L7F22_049412 [Adiantum nelumboides]|nr:hypothetical protein [Adiantum nelumboides]
MAVSSANTSGNPPASNVTEAITQLASSVQVYLDGGPSGDPVASTIVDLTGARPRMLREGGVTAEQVEEVVGQEIDRV